LTRMRYPNDTLGCNWRDWSWPSSGRKDGMDPRYTQFELHREGL